MLLDELQNQNAGDWHGVYTARKVKTKRKINKKVLLLTEKQTLRLFTPRHIPHI